MSRSPRAFLITKDNAAFTFSCGLVGAPSVEVSLPDLALALSSSPRWTELDQAVLVVRTEPVPMLGIIGYFDDAEAFSVESLAGQLQHWSNHLFYADYQRVEKDCRRLATSLKARIPEEILAEGRFVPIPRGGCIVLGILSYFLGLRPEQLEAEKGNEWLFVIDDSAISGARFREFLSKSSAHRVVFAHLYSHPALRRAILDSETRVRECIAVDDLSDRAAEFFGYDYPDWRKRWNERGYGYWSGLPERVCFPWTETDVAIWNSVSQTVEVGWRLMPARRCFKNHAAEERIHIQKSGNGDSFRMSPGVLYAELDGQVLIADMAAGRMFMLEGINARVWKALLNGEYPAVDEIASSGSGEMQAFRNHLDHYLFQLMEAGLVERNSAG